VADAPAALECKVRQIIPMGDGPIAANLVVGEVVMIHVADAVLDASGRPDPRKLRTVARLGGDFWCHTSDLFELKRP
jgi:flavin reductase (DIM6/NTAB) family NADH-FMN oxidoreductase RutF